MSELINLNTAPTNQLMSLPGVGPSLAERIAAQRPLKTLDDLLLVRGVGPAFLDRMRPLVTCSIETNSEEPEVEREGEVEEQETEKGFILIEDTEPEERDEAIPPWEGSPPKDQVPIPEAEEKLPPKEGEIPPEKAIIPIEVDSSKEKPEKKTNFVRRGEVIFIAAVCSLFSFVLTVILTLGMIAALNGGLRFASSAQVADFTRRLDGLSLQAELLTDDIVDLKADVEQLNADMSTTVDQITALTGELDDINIQMEIVQANNETFKAFLDGLRTLLDELP
jgi:hypothetical protein